MIARPSRNPLPWLQHVGKSAPQWPAQSQRFRRGPSWQSLGHDPKMVVSHGCKVHGDGERGEEWMGIITGLYRIFWWWFMGIRVEIRNLCWMDMGWAENHLWRHYVLCLEFRIAATNRKDMVVSWNRGYPKKSSILTGCSLVKQAFNGIPPWL